MRWVGRRTMKIAREATLAAIAELGKRGPVTLRDLAAELHVPRGGVPELRKLLVTLTREGLVQRLGGSRFAARRPARLVRGTLKVARAGYGFIKPDAGEQPGTPDVFIPRREMGGALDGDVVVVRVTEEKPDGRLEGTVEVVVEHAHRILLGVWEPVDGDADDSSRAPGRARRSPASGASGVTGWVRPLDGKVRIRVMASSERELDAQTVVEVEIDAFPEVGSIARGRVTHVVGPMDDPRIDVTIVCRKYGLEDAFPQEVASAAIHAPASVGEDEREGRTDFRGRSVYTIDPETARDFDDAVRVAPRRDGGWDLEVHIADVSHYVVEGSPLDREAERRGTSVYFPGFVVPMLPHALSSGICSLKADVDRLVISALMHVDARGTLVEARFARGVIRSVARLTYPEAQQILDGDPGARQRYPDLVEPLLDAERLARLLRQRRQERGSIDFDLPEAEILWTLEGEMSGIVAADASFTHKLIEEFMLLANEAAARRLGARGGIHRVHERPDPAKLEALSASLQALGYRLEGDLDEPKPQMFQRLVSKAQGRPEERIVSTLALRAMMLARYDTEALGHFGLAARHYTHFTSPIRRYPDLVVHRLLAEREGWTRPRERDLAAIAARGSQRERIAQDAEREVLEVKKARFMLGHLGEEFAGMVLSVDRLGLWVELAEFLVDGHVALGTLTDDDYEVVHGAIVGRVTRRTIRIGDRLTVRVDRVDVETRTIDFSLVGVPEGSVRMRRGKGARATPRPTGSRARGAEPPRPGKRRGTGGSRPPGKSRQGKRR